MIVSHCGMLYLVHIFERLDTWVSGQATRFWVGRLFRQVIREHPGTH